MTILFPSQPFEPKRVDDNFIGEKSALELIGGNFFLFDFDLFIKEDPNAFKHVPTLDNQVSVIYRGWMMRPDEYERLYDELSKRNIILFTRPTAYTRCHLYPLIYPHIKSRAILTYSEESREHCASPAAELDYQKLKDFWDTYGNGSRKLYVKDWVKSAKDTEGATVIENYLNEDEVRSVCEKLETVRGDLFLGGFVFKQYEDIVKRPDGKPEEYRGFFYRDKLFTWSQTHGDGGGGFAPPAWLDEFASKIPGDFYTLDFAYVKDKGFMILEAGDGGVSGLSPGQIPLSFYSGLRAVWEEQKLETQAV